MPDNTLSNARYEKFAQELAKGASQTRAYRAAGFEATTDTANDTNACRLMRRPEVVARVEYLKAQAAAETICTVQDIANQLDEDREFARECKTAAAMVSATMGKAKVLGLIVDKQEHTGKDGADLLPQMTDLELGRKIAFLLTKAQKNV